MHTSLACIIRDVIHLDSIVTVSLLRSGFAAEVFLHVFDGLLIEGALDLAGSLQVVKVLEEVEQLLGALLDVLNRHVSVTVEVKAHPVVADQHLHILVVSG